VKTHTVLGLEHGSSSIVLAYQAQAPEFKPQYPTPTPTHTQNNVLKMLAYMILNS
jgi:hypothetical protein